MLFQYKRKTMTNSVCSPFTQFFFISCRVLMAFSRLRVVLTLPHKHTRRRVKHDNLRDLIAFFTNECIINQDLLAQIISFQPFNPYISKELQKCWKISFYQKDHFIFVLKGSLPNFS